MSARIALIANRLSHNVAKNGSLVESVASMFPDINLLLIDDFALLPEKNTQACTIWRNSFLY